MSRKGGRVRDKSSYGARKAGGIPSSNSAPSLTKIHMEDERHLVKHCTHVLLFIGILAVYTLTISPSVTGGDAGELLAEACHFGIPHPPGEREDYGGREKRRLEKMTWNPSRMVG